MKNRWLWIIATVALVSQTALGQATLTKVRKENVLNCGVNSSVPGFGFTNSKGEFSGFDIDFCKAVAAAVNVPVKYKSLDATARFTALQSGEVGLLSRNTTWTVNRDTKLGFDFAGVIYYDGQGFMVPKKLKVKSVKELNGASICVQSGTTTELNLNDYFRAHKMKFKPVVFEKNEDADRAYLAGRCDAYSTDASGLAGVRSGFKDPENHLILPEVISKEPLGPLVRHGDSQWGDVVRWTLNVLVIAEEKGITSKNVKQMASNPDPEVQRLLGVTGTFGEDLGLDKLWAVRVIESVGNYGEIFARNVGAATPLKLERGLNKLWSDGGLLYSPPYR
jgi:general L-amino acid transport system substrate-binding protein